MRQHSQVLGIRTWLCLQGPRLGLPHVSAEDDLGEHTLRLNDQMLCFLYSLLLKLTFFTSSFWESLSLANANNNIKFIQNHIIYWEKE